MLILDTNHYSEISRRTTIGDKLHQRILDSGDSEFLTIITAEEVTRGWLAAIQDRRHTDRHVRAYRQFQESLKDLNDWDILPWAPDAADIFDELRKDGVSIGTLDLRIASIALEYDAMLLTRNLVDFDKVPGLRVENWLD